MRTTLKRGFGRSETPGDGAGDSLPQRLVSLYRQPAAASRTIRNWAGRVMVSLALVVVALAAGVGGGLYLWFHQSLIEVSSNAPGIGEADKGLHIAVPGKPVIALVLGDNIRAGFQASAGGRSDTIMLVRADPATKTISLLSIPRDLHIPIYCKNTTSVYAVTRIDYAFAYCGALGSLNTIKVLTGLNINYLITVDFNGFKKIVNDLGGIWLNIDRSYYNENLPSCDPACAYANIDLQPGYQLLSGGAALQFVRFRHTDSDFYRQARQQEFIEALKNQMTQHFNFFTSVRVINDLVQNIKVAPALNDSTVLEYAYFAATLPAGHVIQNYISDTAVTSVVFDDQDEIVASPSTIAQAVHAFTHPDVAIAAAANKAALNLKSKKAKKPKRRTKPVVQAPPPDHTTITVLNGNGVAGAAANAAYLLTEKGYVSQLPPDNAVANAPTQRYFDTEIYYEAGHPAREAAAKQLSDLLAPANVAPLPDSTALRALDPGSMLLVIVGTTFQNVLSIAPTTTTATKVATTAPVFHHVQADVAFEPGVTKPELAPLVHRVDFPVYYPSQLEASSVPDQEPGDVPIRLYTITKGHKAIVMVFHTTTGDLAYWDIEESDWGSAPVFQGRSFTRTIDGRTYQLYYNGQNLQMILLHEGNGYYWVTNSLLDALSSETMIAVAKGLDPMSPH